MATTPIAVEQTGAEISTEELHRRLGEPGLGVVDVRPLPLFNGWREADAARGGHIPGAVALPAGWLSRLDGPDLQVLLEDKGLTMSSEIVVYGDPDATSLFRSRAAAHLQAPLRAYADGLADWSSDGSRPVDKLPRHEKLVHPAWLSELLAGGTPEAAPARAVPPVPRELRRPGGIRRQPHPGRALPRHESAREPASAGTGAHRRSWTRLYAHSGSRATPPSSSTAATPRVKPTRSGPVAGPARSPPPGPR